MVPETLQLTIMKVPQQRSDGWDNDQDIAKCILRQILCREELALEAGLDYDLVYHCDVPCLGVTCFSQYQSKITRKPRDLLLSLC